MPTDTCQADPDWTETPLLPVQPEDHPDAGQLDPLLRFVTGNPADYVDEDLKRWADTAQASGQVYADYGESIYIPGTGRIMRPWAGAPWSPSQLARAYVALQEWPWMPIRPSGWGWREIEGENAWVQEGPDSWGAVPPPAIRFRGAASGEWAYVDLYAAYWQIGSRFPWWVAKPGSRRIMRGMWGRSELLYPLRQVRLNLFGMLTYPGGGVTWVYPDGSTKTGDCPPSQAKMANPAWGTAILWTVHAIAQDLMETFPGVPLWHTDGALIPAEQEASVVSWLDERWRVTARVKERGEGTVSGIGNYSWRRSHNPAMPSVPHSNLVIPPAEVETIREWWLSYRAGI